MDLKINFGGFFGTDTGIKILGELLGFFRKLIFVKLMKFRMARKFRLRNCIQMKSFESKIK